MTVPAQRPPRANPELLPVLATVTYLATLIAAWGILSLALDRDVVDYADAGPLLGPPMALGACVVTWAFSRAALRGRAPALAIAAVVVSWLVVIAIGAIGYTAPTILATAVHFAISPFVLAAALLSGLTVLATRGLAPRRR